MKRRDAWRQGTTWLNPYYLTAARNWRVFLGLDGTWLSWRRVLFPSTHLPAGDGLHWDALKRTADEGLGSFKKPLISV